MRRSIILALLLAACGQPEPDTVYVMAGIGGGSIVPRSSGGSDDPSPVFSFRPDLGSGPHRLSVDQFSLTTDILCDARTATEAAGWPCTTGGTFVENPATATVVTGAYAPFTDPAARATVTSGANAAWEGATTSIGDITTEDFRLITVARPTLRGSQQQIAGKLTGSTGYRIGLNASNQYIATVNATTITSSVAVDAFGQWDILDLQCDRSGAAGSMRLYQNGYLIASGVCPTASATAASSKFTIAANSDAAGVGFVNGNIAYVALRKGADAFTSTAAMDAAAQQTAQELMGVWPEEAVTPAPLSTDIRATVAHLDIDRDQDGVVKFFRVGQNWLRVGKRRDTTVMHINVGGEYGVGYLGESAAINKIPRSTEFNTSWSLLNAGDNIQTERYFVPDTSDDGDRLRGGADAVGTEHGVRGTTSTLTAEPYVFSVVFIYDGTSGTQKPFGWLRDNTVANTATWFDLQACRVTQTGSGLTALANPPHTGTTTTALSARAEYLGTVSSIRFCRAQILVTGTVAAHAFDIGFSDASGTLTSTVATLNDTLGGLWAAQVEKVVLGHWATTPIHTTTGDASRNLDGLRFDIANWPSSGTLAWMIKAPNSRISMSVETAYACTPYQDADDYVLLKTTQSSGSGARGGTCTSGAQGVYADVMTGGASQLNACGNPAGFGQWYAPGSYNMHDGQSHHARMVFGTNDVRVFVDGDQTAGITDTTVTMPTLTGGHIAIGYESATGANQFDGLTQRCDIYNREFEPTYP